MAYTNFDDAWTTCNNTFPSVQINMVNFYNAKGSINPGITLANLIVYTRQCFNYLYTAIVQHIGTNWLDPIDNSWHMMALYFAGQAQVDMDSIIAAMYDAEYDEVRDFIGCEWAFQQILWDQPFFPEQYAEIVNRIRT